MAEPTTSLTAAGWQLAGIADYNEDAFSDILWRNYATGGNAIWVTGPVQNNNLTVGSVISLPPTADPNWQIAGPR